MAGKTNGRRNRRAGHDLERLVIRLFRDSGFPHVVSCRAENVTRDGQGIDLINTDEHVNGRLEYNVQCKNTVDRPQYDKLLATMPKLEKVINVIIHKYTIRSKTKQKPGGPKPKVTFIPRGHYAIMDMNDFLAMAKELKVLREIAIDQAKQLA